MESRVEGDDLRDGRQDFLHRADTQQVGRVVQGGEVTADFDLRKHILIDEGTAGEEVRTLDDTVADGLDVIEGLQHTALRIHEGVEQELHADFVIRDGKGLHQVGFAAGLVGQDAFGKSDLFDDAFREKVIYIIALHIKKLILDGRTAAINYKYDHR